uniref:RanBP-type and C3HC4-type zinc finger-containing protein 1 n=1 Tax=Eutreptiella gymnastica TaxID=73025 RepID=A0A7S1IQI0_9EUGL
MGHEDDLFVGLTEKDAYEYTCPICHLILEDPVSCLGTHYFCKTCLSGWMTKSDVCPLDRTCVLKEETIRVEWRVAAKIKDLRVRCPCKRQGSLDSPSSGPNSTGSARCSWEGRLEDLPHHTESCAVVGCPHCETRLFTSELPRHVQNCRQRMEERKRRPQHGSQSLAHSLTKSEFADEDLGQKHENGCQARPRKRQKYGGDAPYPVPLPGLEGVQGAAQWACTACTLLNDEAVERCGACGALRAPVLSGGEEGQAVAQWVCAACTLRNDEAAEQCGACDGPRSAALPVLEEAQRVAQWQCTDCTLLNDVAAELCGACSARRPTMQVGDWHFVDGRYTLYVSETDRDRPFVLEADVFNRLYNHQRDGVQWLWERYRVGSGGLLGDDMGLGKTIQIISFLEGMLHARRIKHALVLVPKSVLENWVKEFTQWAPTLSVHRLGTEASADKRKRVLEKLYRTGGVCLMNDSLLGTTVQLFEESPITWDYVVLDEGHRIKNPSIQMSKNVRKIKTENRVLLSGTPLQNNLDELWALFNFVSKGRILGSRAEFKRSWADPIARSHERDATDAEKELGEALGSELRDMYQPYFLRRDKQIVLDQSGQAQSSSSAGPQAAVPVLSAVKYDFVVWLTMTPVQLDIYRKLLDTTFFKDTMEQLGARATPQTYNALLMLQQVCNHPWLLLKEDFHSSLTQAQLQGADHKLEVPIRDGTGKTATNHPPVRCCMLSDCSKLVFTCELLALLKRQGHRVLVFSRSVKMLDIVQMWLERQDMRHSRLDGSVKQPAERQQIVDRFNANPKIFCCLLTSQVGGVGLTLTGADRVLILDPSWNPANDNQAVDRAFRIGQTRDVVVYRLITCGTVEEKMYRRQVFKQGLALQAMGTDDVIRHFTKMELRQMFQLGVTDYSETAYQLNHLNQDAMQYSDAVLVHMDKLHDLPEMTNYSDHGLAFDQKQYIGTSAEAQREAAENRKRLEMTSVDDPDQEIKAASQWKCRSCTLLNDLTDGQCVACSTRRSQSPAGDGNSWKQRQDPNHGPKTKLPRRAVKSSSSNASGEERSQGRFRTGERVIEDLSSDSDSTGRWAAGDVSSDSENEEVVDVDEAIASWSFPLGQSSSSTSTSDSWGWRNVRLHPDPSEDYITRAQGQWYI